MPPWLKELALALSAVSIPALKIRKFGDRYYGIPVSSSPPLTAQERGPTLTFPTIADSSSNALQAVTLISDRRHSKKACTKIFSRESA
jgi:hypothetical protein